MLLGETTLRRESTVTDTAVAVMSTSTSTSERALIDEIIAAVLDAHPSGGMVDSHRVAEQLVKRRQAAGTTPDPRQTTDYVQYLFRESPAHVCRHADGGSYRIHPEPQCGTGCDVKYRHTAPTQVREHCEHCHMELTTSGDCPLGC